MENKVVGCLQQPEVAQRLRSELSDLHQALGLPLGEGLTYEHLLAMVVEEARERAIDVIEEAGGGILDVPPSADVRTAMRCAGCMPAGLPACLPPLLPLQHGFPLPAATAAWGVPASCPASPCSAARQGNATRRHPLPCARVRQRAC